MTLEELKEEYDKLQKKYGDKNLDSIYFGGCTDHPDICFVFMNPTGRNIASNKSWKSLKAPWIGTKNIWDLFDALGLIDKDIYEEIKKKKSNDWDYDFANLVYENVKKHKYFITNLGKCTQVDARPLSDSVYKKYLKYLKEEFKMIQPRVIILFGNQVSSIVLNEKISVSKVRKQEFKRTWDNMEYHCYSVYYPIGNGRFNIDKSVEDIKYVIEKLKEEIKQ